MKSILSAKHFSLLLPLLVGQAAATDTVIETDVVVVGAGPSGLMSASVLRDSGAHVVVLEAKERLGGRCRSIQRKSGEGIIELGATWINNKTQPAVFALTEMLGLETATQWTKGDYVHEDRAGTVHVISSSDTNSADPEDALVVGQLYEYIELAAFGVDLEDYSKFDEEWDVTMADFIAFNETLAASAHVNATMTSLSAQLVGRESHEVGAHYLLDYIKSGGSLQKLGGEDADGAQYLKVKNGTTAIFQGLADNLEDGSVYLNTPVEAINHCNDHIIVASTTGQLFQAKKVIMANPTNTYKDITFIPKLPAEKTEIVSNTKGGNYAKLILSYNSAWWRDAGLNGEFVSLNGPACFTWDTTDTELEQYSLAVFVAGDVARDWHELPGKAEKKLAVVEHLAEIASEIDPELKSKALDVTEVNMAEWTLEPYLEGGPTSSMGPGMLRKYGAALREPFGKVYFGGGETAFEGKGYLEGAVLAGERVAKEVLRDLRAESDDS